MRDTPDTTRFEELRKDLFQIALDLAQEWSNLQARSRPGTPIGEDGYPFHKSFDDLTVEIGAWTQCPVIVRRLPDRLMVQVVMPCVDPARTVIARLRGWTGEELTRAPHPLAANVLLESAINEMAVLITGRKENVLPLLNDVWNTGDRPYDDEWLREHAQSLALYGMPQ